MKNLLRIIAVVVSLTFIAPLSFAAEKKGPEKSPPPAVEKKGEKKAEAKTALIDINTATKAELDALPGIGGAFSQKIIDGRPYAKKDQLKSRKILPEATYEKIKDSIIAKQPPKK